MPAPTRKASWKPEVRASGIAVPAATSLSVREIAIVERSAIPTAPPTCCDVLISPEAIPASAWLTPASAAIEIGTKQSAIPSATIRKPGQQVGRVRPVDRDLREQQQADREDRHPARDQRPDSDLVHEHRGDVRPDDRRAGDREVRDARLHRRVPEHLLHVQRQHQEHREQRRAEDEAGHVGSEDRLRAEDPEAHQRLLDAVLPERRSRRAAPPRARRRRSCEPSPSPSCCPG